MINYAKDMLCNISDDGMTEELWDLVHEDEKVLSNIKVENDNQRNLYFYLDMFYDDLCNEFGCKAEKSVVLKNAFDLLKSREDIELVDIYYAVYNSLKKIKLAYPNTQYIVNRKPVYDIAKWIQTLGKIYNVIENGKDINKKIQNIMEGFSLMERNDFSAWARYYNNQDNEKYAMKKSAEEIDTPVEEFIPPPKKEKTLEELKKSLISRLDSAARLLRKFVDVWPTGEWNTLYQSLTDLQREILTLKTASTAKDRIIKIANIWNNKGFVEGAELLKKVAEGDLASKVEKALKGKEYDLKDTPDETMPVGNELGEIPFPPEDDLEEMSPPTEEMGTETPAGVEETLPEPPEALEEVKETEVVEPQTTNEENPFSGKTVQDVIDLLQPLAKTLNDRDLVRKLSMADMMLDSMNMASFFTELGEATAKGLELSTYVGTRLDKIINKLKGGVKNKSAEVPEIDMGEFSKEKGNEKEMFEVEEGK